MNKCACVRELLFVYFRLTSFDFVKGLNTIAGLLIKKNFKPRTYMKWSKFVNYFKINIELLFFFI